ncbi:glycosyltransferase family 4 protein [Algoriphagus litoralis]|uniref:glycosyltransferase family 4 protein n=1 Tax=Algoriphagus litoralis TaxID=2202829 RepID=UPI000DBA38C8|nr:glycosyltransferase family 4 protein [Algoriphagus litoralis]
MKILQILQKPQRRGAELFAAQLSQELTILGHQVILVFLYPGKDTLPFKGVRVHLFGSKNLDIISWYRLARLIKEIKPDIVQANAGDTLKFAGLSRFFFGWKSPLIFRNANQISGFMDSTPKRIFYTFLLSQIQSVASVSLLCMQDFQKVFQWTKPIAHLPIGTEIGFSSSQMPSDLEKFLDGNPFLLHIGSFVPEKNHEGLFRIFKKIHQSFPTVSLVLCGDGPLRSKLEKEAPAGIIFLGSRLDVNSILPHAKALLLPSLIEGLPGVILEAMAAKVPVVSYDTGGISEVIIPKQTGFLIPKNDENSFAKLVMETILSPEADLSELVENAYALVKENYSIKAIASQFEKFYLNQANGGKNTHS